MSDKFLEAMERQQKIIEKLTGSMPGDAAPTVTFEPPRNHFLADRQYEIILKAIADFEADLDDDHEVAVKLTSFGQTIVLSVTDVGYHNPSILYFYGFVEGKPATLVQHVSQLNFLLLSVQKLDESRPARRIGFQSSQSETESLE